MGNALITGLKTAFDTETAKVFVREGYKVFAAGSGQINGVTLIPADLKDAVKEILKYTGSIDIYIDVSDERSPLDNFELRAGVNDLVMRELYDANVIKPMAMLEAFLPLLEAGEGKRVCYLTSAQASINETRETDGYGYKMAKAGLHNFLQITRNVLAPRGYTIRVFDPADGRTNGSALTARQAAEAAFNYFSRMRGIERGDPQRDDETNLVFRDAYGRQHSW